MFNCDNCGRPEDRSKCFTLLWNLDHKTLCPECFQRATRITQLQNPIRSPKKRRPLILFTLPAVSTVDDEPPDGKWIDGSDQSPYVCVNLSIALHDFHEIAHELHGLQEMSGVVLKYVLKGNALLADSTAKALYSIGARLLRSIEDLTQDLAEAFEERKNHYDKQEQFETDNFSRQQSPSFCEHNTMIERSPAISWPSKQNSATAKRLRKEVFCGQEHSTRTIQTRR